MLKIKGSLLVCALALALVLGTFGCGGGQGGASEEVDSVVIGTAGQGGTYYFVGEGMANVIDENTDIQATAQATAGGIENARQVGSGEMDLGLMRTLDIRTTTGDGTVDVSDLKAVASNHNIAYHVTVPADSDIQSMDQLFVEGRRMGTGEPGSSIQGDARDMLAVYGLTLDDIEEHPLSQSEQARSLQDDTIESALFPGGIPVASVSEVATSTGARILPATDEFLEGLREYQPDLAPVEIPAGTYSGIDTPVRTFSIPAILVVRADMPDDAVYDLVRAIQENSEDVADVHPAGAESSIENAFSGAEYYTGELGLKFHPGAIRWYEEQGVWSEEYE
jgi:uncharacterized protein